MKKDLPEVGDLVVVTIREVKGFGANARLDEYRGKEGSFSLSVSNYVRAKIEGTSGRPCECGSAYIAYND